MTDSVARRGNWRDWMVVVLLMSAMIFSFVDRFTLSLLVEPIKRDLGISDTQVGLLNGVAFGLFYAAMGLPMGWLADRWSRKRTIMLGIAVWSVATAACGLASNMLQLLLARIGVGAGEAGLAPASYAIVHDRFPMDRLGRAMSLFQVGTVLGAGLSFILAGQIYAFFLAGGGSNLVLVASLKPWQQTFIAVALPGILFFGLVALIAEPGRVDDDHGSQTARISMTSALASNPAIYALLFSGMSGVILSNYALLSWIPAILTREYGWTPVEVGSTYGMIILLVSPIGLLSGGWIADALVHRSIGSAHAKIALAAAGLALPAAIAMGLSATSSGFLIGAAVLHLVLALPIGVVPAYIQVLTPAAARGQVSALYVLTVNLFGLGAGPTLIGAISSLSPGDPTALRIAMASVVVPFLIAATLILWLLVRRTAPRAATI